jgi:hypothetical protein
MKKGRKFLRGQVAILETQVELFANELNVAYNQINFLVQRLTESVKLERDNSPLSKDRAEAVIFLNATSNAVTLIDLVQDALNSAAEEIHYLTGEATAEILQRLINDNIEEWERIRASMVAASELLDD